MKINDLKKALQRSDNSIDSIKAIVKMEFTEIEYEKELNYLESKLTFDTNEHSKISELIGKIKVLTHKVQEEYDIACSLILNKSLDYIKNLTKEELSNELFDYYEKLNINEIDENKIKFIWD